RWRWRRRRHLFTLPSAQARALAGREAVTALVDPGQHLRCAGRAERAGRARHRHLAMDPDLRRYSAAWGNSRLSNIAASAAPFGLALRRARMFSRDCSRAKLALVTACHSIIWFHTGSITWAPGTVFPSTVRIVRLRSSDTTVAR